MFSTEPTSICLFVHLIRYFLPESNFLVGVILLVKHENHDIVGNKILGHVDW